MTDQTPDKAISKTEMYKIVGEGDISHGKNRVDYWDNQYGFKDAAAARNPYNRRESIVWIDDALEWLEEQEWMTLGDYRRIKKELEKY